MILHTQYNKAVYVTLYNAIITVLVVALHDFGHYEVSATLQGAVATLGSALFTWLIPNADAPETP